MAWTKESIVKELKKLNKSKADLSYNQLARVNQSLVSAAAYYFGSYRAAVEEAGIDYADVTRRPRWTPDRIVALIKKADKAGEELHWSAVTRRDDELKKAAFASLQDRLFGTWDAALTAAGLDPTVVSRYRRWDEGSIRDELQARQKAKRPLNSGTLQKEDPGLHAAAVRYFGNFDSALREAGIDPLEHRRRRRWDQKAVLDGLKMLKANGNRMSDSTVRAEDAALYGAAVRLFGSFTKARTAAGITAPKRATADS